MTARAKGVLLLMVCVAVSLHGIVGAQIRVPSENQVRAKFLYSFSKFVTWPDEAFSDSADSFVIGILRDEEFADVLQETVEGKFVARRSVAVRRWTTLDSLRACHILYVSGDDVEGLAERLTPSVRHHMLTVGNRTHFADWGGVIGIVFRDNKVQFEVDRVAAEKAELKISSLLLTAASAANKE